MKYLFSLCLGAFLCWATPALALPTVQDMSQNLVEQLPFARTIAAKAVDYAASNPGFQTLSNQVGFQDAQLLVWRQVEKLLPRYQAALDQQVVDTFSRHFSLDELTQIAKGQGDVSSYVMTVMQRIATDPEARKAMEDLLIDMGTQAVKAALATLPPIKYTAPGH